MKYKYADCSFCGGKVEEKKVTVDYRWKNDLTIVEGVPAGVCTQCGEQYFRGKIAEEMERLVKEKGEITQEVTVPMTTFK